MQTTAAAAPGKLLQRRGAAGLSALLGTSALALVLIAAAAAGAVAAIAATTGAASSGQQQQQQHLASVRLAAAPCAHEAAEEADDALSSPPPERAIVDNLAAELGAQLRARGLRTLLVVGRWPADTEAATATLSWQQVGGSAPGVAIEFARDEAALAELLRRGKLAASPPPPRSWLFGGNAAGGVKQARCSSSSGGDTALLLWSPRGKGGGVSLLDAALAGAARAALGGCLGLTAAFGRHADKPDALVFLGADDRPYRAAFASSAVFRDTFSRIYDQKVWGSGDAGGGGSGAGSNFNYTATIRRELPRLIKQYGVRSMLDSSCGSMHWMPLVLGNVSEADPGFRFAGTDVACSLIERHRKTFAARKAWRFECVDYSAQRLLAGYDLVWSRDSLQHVPLHATWQFLNQVKRSGARFLLVGSYVNGGENVDIKGGDYYEINLLRPPFSLRPPPLEVIDERTPDGKHMLLFDVRALTWDDALLGLV